MNLINMENKIEFIKKGFRKQILFVEDQVLGILVTNPAFANEIG